MPRHEVVAECSEDKGSVGRNPGWIGERAMHPENAPEKFGRYARFSGLKTGIA
jgi:hypothetical protein